MNVKKLLFGLNLALFALILSGCSSLNHKSVMPATLAPEATVQVASNPEPQSAEIVPETSEKISDRHIAVHLYTADQWVGSGTLLFDECGQPDRIVSSGHIFWKGFGPRVYEYRALVGDLRGFISKINSRPLPELLDLAVCEVGDPQPVEGSEHFVGSEEWTNRKVIAERYSQPLQVTSRSTQEQALVIGSLREENGVTSYVITRENPQPAESGAGFYDDEGRLFVLRSDIKTTPEVRQFFNLEDTVTALTVAVAITLVASN